MSAAVEFSVDDQIGHLQLNRPEVLNAMDRPLFSRLEVVLGEALIHARKENNPLLVLLVSGAGRAFSAGTDLRELEATSAAAAGELALLENRLMNALADFPRPTVAAVQGYALGGGCELAMACDLRVAAADAVFGQPEIDMGWLPAAGGTFRLASLVGRANALDVILTGRRLGADEAARLGLVQRVVPPIDLMEEAMSVARTLRHKDPFAIGQGLNLLRGRDMFKSRAVAVECEAAVLAECASRPEAQERIRAFLKR